MNKVIFTSLLFLSFTAIAQTSGIGTPISGSNTELGNPAGTTPTNGTHPPRTGGIFDKSRRASLPTNRTDRGEDMNKNNTLPTQNCEPNDFACMQMQGNSHAQ